MARKKIVFIIVEGPSDEEALGVLFSKYFENEEVHVEIMHCDITCKKGVNSSNILKEVTNVIKQYSDRNHFKQIHFKQIIHIVDTDGAFCSKEDIEEKVGIKNFEYSQEKILAGNKEAVLIRNKQKSDNLIKISRTNLIWNIPYSVHYMSCNLEHVLFNKLNCSDEEKETLSYQFALKYRDNIKGFINFISNSSFSVKSDYLTSWKFIETDNNSLKRFSNLSLCFKKEIDKNK